MIPVDVDDPFQLSFDFYDCDPEDPSDCEKKFDFQLSFDFYGTLEAQLSELKALSTIFWFLLGAAEANRWAGGHPLSTIFWFLRRRIRTVDEEHLQRAFNYLLISTRKPPRRLLPRPRLLFNYLLIYYGNFSYVVPTLWYAVMHFNYLLIYYAASSLREAPRTLDDFNYLLIYYAYMPGPYKSLWDSEISTIFWFTTLPEQWWSSRGKQCVFQLSFDLLQIFGEVDRGVTLVIFQLSFDLLQKVLQMVDPENPNDFNYLLIYYDGPGPRRAAVASIS